MARIPLISEHDQAVPEEARDALDAARRGRGRLINLYRALANRPDALRAFSGLATTVYRSGSTLKPIHAELAYLTATAVNDCFY